MKKVLTGILTGTMLFFSVGCIIPTNFKKAPTLKQNNKKISNPIKYVDYPLERGKIMIKISEGEAWKNFERGLDLYALSMNKARLTPKEVYEFIRPFDENKNDIYNFEECKKLREKSRSLYDISILGELEKLPEQP